MRVLFLCQEGEHRSVAGARVLMDLVGACVGLDIDSAGLAYLQSRPTLEVRKSLGDYQDIFVMDRQTKQRLVHRYGVPHSKIHNLQIPDNFDTRSKAEKEQLERTLTVALSPFTKRYQTT